MKSMFSKFYLRSFKTIILVFLLTVNATIFAADPPPLAMVRNTSNQMIVELNKHLGRLQGNTPLVSGIVRRLLLPHVDVTNMSQMVVGRLYWQPAGSSLQRQFISHFTTYVIRTYAAAISNYDGETIDFYPLRGYSGQASAQVNSRINRKDGPPIQVQYRVVNRGGNWLVYDFSVDGVSFVQNYRSQFAGTLRQGGLKLLVQKLIEKNR